MGINFRNPNHHFGYVRLPSILDVDFSEDKEAMCWDSFNLVAREIYKSEVDIMVKIGGGVEVYLGKATEIRTCHGMRYLRIDTTNCAPSVFSTIVEHYTAKTPSYMPSPYFVSLHLDPLIKDIRLRADTMHDEDGMAYDTVLNMIVITLKE
ncbi:hypothetical protein DEEACLCL_00149 [Salmonella phage CRW-SP2]|nr:hypothetical protein DEEACLCL_00149 [Salmonella phage CRW-SP2]